MADATKHLNGGTLVPDLKRLFSIRTKRTRAFAYGFVFVFIGFTAFLAYNSSSENSSPWFSNFSISKTSNSSATITVLDGSVRSSFSSIYSYIFPRNSSDLSQNSSSFDDGSENLTFELSPRVNKDFQIVKNFSDADDLHGKVEILKSNQSTNESSIVEKSSLGRTNATGNGEKEFADKGVVNNFTVGTISAINSSSSANGHGEKTVAEKGMAKNSTIGPTFSSNSSSPANGPGEKEVAEEGLVKNATVASKSQSLSNRTTDTAPRANSIEDAEKKIAKQGVVQNFTTSLAKKRISNGSNFSASAKQGLVRKQGGNGTDFTVSAKQGNEEDLIKGLVNCDLFDGDWIRDESYPLYKPGSCSLIDEQFNCFLNGRPDKGYQQLKWKPNGCTLPRLNASNMLDLLRGKRLVFVGDSLNRNMWESLICILKNSAKDQSKVYEASGKVHFRTEVSYSFVFEDYKFTVDFFVAPFLVRESEFTSKNGSKKETLRLDLMSGAADNYKTADIVIFNTGHWWTHDKTARGKDYYQEGSHVYSELNVLEAFRKAMTTWGKWIDANINPTRTSVFFRGYSVSHFSGGQWNSGGQCDDEVEPIKNKTYLAPYPPMMTTLEGVLKGMKTPVSFLNVTILTDYRKDGHPSIYRKQKYSEQEKIEPLKYQDCSHWCLPGVPDAWNELLYAELLLKEYQKNRPNNNTSKKEHKM